MTNIPVSPLLLFLDGGSSGWASEEADLQQKTINQDEI